MSWTSRERVIAAIEHREGDRVPIDITPLYDFYINLKKYLGMDVQEEVKPNSAMEVVPHPAVLKKLGVDLISVKLGSPHKIKTDQSNSANKKDEWGLEYCKVSQPGGGHYMEVVEHPFAEATLDDLKDYPWPIPDLPGRGEGAEKSARQFYENTDLGIIGRFGGPVLELAGYLMGLEKFMMRSVTDPEFVGALLDKITEIQIALDRIGLEATAKYIQIFKVSGEDLGMQTGPLYSPRMFKEIFLPRLKRRWQAARKYLDDANPSVKIMLHSCGSVRKFIPDLVAAGIQILDPVQPHAAGMDSFELKRDFGRDLTFHGGVDIQQVLPFGTTREVEDEVRLRLRAFAPGGGYILSPSHNIQADTPPTNIVSMCQAAQRFGQFPIEHLDTKKEIN